MANVARGRPRPAQQAAVDDQGCGHDAGDEDRDGRLADRIVRVPELPYRQRAHRGVNQHRDVEVSERTGQIDVVPAQLRRLYERATLEVDGAADAQADAQDLR
ncbi:hypothetical protein JOF29_007199 [Kribbella aluminosa]|uniref:Uncharacterized protein n=1 Tax=Kribbella aluminosa TaxID=416017 RepID=A0ABS4UWS0_9ACTN|nr:hypothetical protein [Kribbella aluminosa]MBP2356089.1 hypothetical protein [Kribbella aluminosa]